MARNEYGFSARRAERLSRQAGEDKPDYTSSNTMEKFDQADQADQDAKGAELQGLANDAKGIERCLSQQQRASRAKGKQAPATKVQEQPAERKQKQSDSQANRPSRNTAPASRSKTTRPGKKPSASTNAAKEFPTPPRSASSTDNRMLQVNMDSDGGSSTLSELSEDEFANIAVQSKPPIPSPKAPTLPSAAPPDDHASLSDTVTLAEDTQNAETGRNEARQGFTNRITEALTDAGESITVETRHRASTEQITAAGESNVSPQPAGQEQEVGTTGKPKRKTAAPQRYGLSEHTTSTGTLSAQLMSDPIAEEAEDGDYEGSPKKRRKTPAATTPRTLKQPRTPKHADPPPEQRDASSRKAPAKSKFVKLKLTSSPTEFNTILQSPPPATPKTSRNTPAKPTRKQAPKVIPKSPVSASLPPTPESITAEPVRPEIPMDANKVALSQRLTAREPLGSKPQAQGQPLVWADSRQALCETLPYFKRPQGGCYQNDSHVYGFLFDSVGHCREYLDEDVIICRAGGSMEQDPSGGMVQKKDQSMKEAQVLAVLNDIAHQNPLIVICGNRNGGAKCEMPHQYSVLGWYKPVAVWEEKTAGRGKKIWTTIKYRLERLNQVGEPVPWHAPAGSEIAELRTAGGQVHREQCAECGKKFDQVYLQGWMCLNSACDRFWLLDNGFSAPAGNTGLDYNPDFLLSRARAWSDETVSPAPVRPPIPDVGKIIGDDLAYINTRGICCPKCGRCNSRRLFDRWVCENPSCDYELRPQHRPVMPTHLHTPWDVAPTLVRNKVESGVHLKVEHKYGYKVCTYTFDGIEGCFIHAAATKSILSAAGGPDDMMANLQSEDLGLERRVFASTKMSGGKKAEIEKPSKGNLIAPLPPPDEQQAGIPPIEHNDPAKDKRVFDEGDLMTAFSMNYGMPYKFVASGASRSFESSPKATCLDFNEELIFTYLEGQKIEYHDDGEDGLGPEIASLSLGGRAKMHMRMKAKHFVGCSKTGILTEEKPVPGTIDGPAMYEKRLAAWEELQELKLKPDTVAYNKRRKELPKELGIFEKRAKKADDLVTITLSHGDIMVMDGYDIQRYLEHKVVPEGYLRFALTCRTVLEDHLKSEEKPDYAVQPDEGRYNGSVGY